MATRAAVPAIPDPDWVEDETAVIPKGETQYRMILDEDEVELLARGVCPERISEAAYGMLHWKRERNRMTARKLAEPISVSSSAAHEER